MRTLSISLLSVILTLIVIANAFYQKKQFYPSVVYITKSNPSMAVIYIQAFICVWICGKIMRKIFFGQLRTTEFEHLMERSWYAITETCLAFTVFRDDFNPKFVALFTLLLFLKSFHWLAEDRVDYMERSPVISWLFHTRVLSLLLLLGALDLHFVQHAYLSTVAKGASVQLVFGFEYAVLLTVVINIIIKYALHSVDLNSETPWDNKAVFLLYTELVMGLIKVILYVAFVAIMVRIYTLPLFAFRPMYYTIRNFKKAFSDVILSRRAIHNMNTLYPDATPEELAAADNVCIICREEMLTASKKLPCNHIFHTSCLRSWFQRQQTCPTCRLNILRNPTNNNNTRNPPPAAAAAPPPGERLGGAPAPNPFVNPFFGAAPAQHPFHMFQNLPAAAAAAAAAAAPPPDAQQQPRPAHAGTSGPAPSTSAPPTGTSAAPGSSFAFPPPPFPFVPFMPPPPPPMPPQHLARLSAEELRRMEGNEKENVEARIQCLRNIQMLLDAAVMMMQQYSSTVVMSQQMAQPTSTSSNPSNPSTSNGTLHGGIWDNTSSSAESPKIAKVAPTTSSSPFPSQSTTLDEGDLSKPSSSNEPSSSKDTNMTEEPTSTSSTVEEEIRRRRLQKFQQQQQTEVAQQD